MRKYIISLAICLVAFSCNDDLNVEPDFLSESAVFEDSSLTEAYIAQIYESMQFMITSSFGQTNMGLISAVGAEAIAFANWQAPNVAYLRTYSQQNGTGTLGYWAYGAIRQVNFLLENIKNSQTFEQDYIDEKILEARFLRAFIYFDMVKRYGGVPLITKVQKADDPQEELFPKRAKEQEIYDFIYNELNDIIGKFSDDRKGAEGRVDKYTALALQSRAMLYAASIANFGEIDIDGVVGIPVSLAQEYYQRSYNASKAIEDSRVFSLFNTSADKVKNFGDLFLTDGLSNSEVIFAEVYEPEVRGHNLDYLAHPDGFNTVWNSNFPVLYDFAELFEYKDGRPNVPRSMLTASNDWDIQEFFGEKDPRFVASVFFPQTNWRGQEVYFHTNTTYTKEDGTTTTTNRGNIDINGGSWPAAGPARSIRNTALLLRKRLDPELPIANVIPLASGQDFFVFRYGETLLNKAEAAFYLNRSGEALDAINEIRDRAGMPNRTAVTEENIRLERQVELAFENHRFWDLIRWRIAVEKLDGIRMAGLTFRYNLDTDRYIITTKNAETQTRIFGKERYYLPISQFLLSDNENLIQNPGY